MQTAGISIEPMHPEEWDAVCAIYLEGIDTRNATFETAAPGWEAWHASHLPVGRFVARDEGRVVGWCALSAVSSRCVYAGVAEVSVYIAAGARGRGVGRLLLETLIEVSESNGIWTLQAGIFAENEASLRLHRSCGFRDVGRRERIGRLEGVWRDVLLLERRSRLVGIDAVEGVPDAQTA